MANPSGKGGFQKGQSGNPAGRKKGSTNKRTRELTAEALDRIESLEGKTPIEIMYEVARAYHQTWVGMTEAPLKEGEKRDPVELMAIADKAAHWAKECAPYFHARLANVTVDNDEGDYEITVADHTGDQEAA